MLKEKPGTMHTRSNYNKVYLKQSNPPHLIYSQLSKCG